MKPPVSGACPVGRRISRNPFYNFIDGDFPRCGDDNYCERRKGRNDHDHPRTTMQKKGRCDKKKDHGKEGKGITFRNRASSFCCRRVHAASGSFWAVCCSMATPNITPTACQKRSLLRCLRPLLPIQGGLSGEIFISARNMPQQIRQCRKVSILRNEPTFEISLKHHANIEG